MPIVPKEGQSLLDATAEFLFGPEHGKTPTHNYTDDIPYEELKDMHFAGLNPEQTAEFLAVRKKKDEEEKAKEERRRKRLIAAGKDPDTYGKILVPMDKIDEFLETGTFTPDDEPKPQKKPPAAPIDLTGIDVNDTVTVSAKIPRAIHKMIKLHNIETGQTMSEYIYDLIIHDAMQ
jgi:hypothetical protein